MENPDTFNNFIKNVAEKRNALVALKPKKTEVIASQKLLAGLAKQNDVSIVSLKPVEDEIPFYLEDPEAIGEEEEREPEKARDIQLALLEIRLKGEYAAICSYLEQVETTSEATFVIEKVNIQLVEEKGASWIEAAVAVRLYYSVEA